jgi:hypothetical protein
MGERQHPDRRGEDRERHRAAEDLDRDVARRHLAEHPRHDAATRERVEVRAHRMLGTRPAGDVRERLGRHHLARPGLQALRRQRQLRPRSGEAAQVDVVLNVAQVPDRHTAFGRSATPALLLG